MNDVCRAEKRVTSQLCSKRIMFPNCVRRAKEPHRNPDIFSVPVQFIFPRWVHNNGVLIELCIRFFWLTLKLLSFRVVVLRCSSFQTYTDRFFYLSWNVHIEV